MIYILFAAWTPGCPNTNWLANVTLLSYFLRITVKYYFNCMSAFTAERNRHCATAQSFSCSETTVKLVLNTDFMKMNTQWWTLITSCRSCLTNRICRVRHGWCIWTAVKIRLKLLVFFTFIVNHRFFSHAQIYWDTANYDANEILLFIFLLCPSSQHSVSSTIFSCVG